MTEKFEPTVFVRYRRVIKPADFEAIEAEAHFHVSAGKSPQKTAEKYMALARDTAEHEFGLKLEAAANEETQSQPAANAAAKAPASKPAKDNVAQSSQSADASDVGTDAGRDSDAEGSSSAGKADGDGAAAGGLSLGDLGGKKEEPKAAPPPSDEKFRDALIKGMEVVPGEVLATAFTEKFGTHNMADIPMDKRNDALTMLSDLVKKHKV